MKTAEDKKISKASKMKGSVVSNKMDKTIVVAVERLKTHPKYLKKYTSTKRYKVHTGDKKYEIGDTVVFQECRPISRDKRHKIVL
jgi:small subunit ribosomal protein S17